MKNSQGCNSSALVNISKYTTFEYVFLLFFFPPPCSEIIDNEQRDRATKIVDDTVKQAQELRGARHLQIGRLKGEEIESKEMEGYLPTRVITHVTWIWMRVSNSRLQDFLHPRVLSI